MKFANQTPVIDAADAICEDMGYDSYKDLENEEIDFIATRTQVSLADVRDVLNI
jgi:hypothetical protein